MTHAIIFEQSPPHTHGSSNRRDGGRFQRSSSQILGVCVSGVRGGGGGVLAQARQGRRHKLDASSFVKECLSEPQWAHVSMKQFIVQLAAGCPPTEGSPFAFSGNDNSCFGWRELEGLPLPLLGPVMVSNFNLHP